MAASGLDGGSRSYSLSPDDQVDGTIPLNDRRAGERGRRRPLESNNTRQSSSPENMRTAGMIGGLGPESSIDYYRSILARYRARKPDNGYPHLVINSLDVDRAIALLDAGRLSDLTDYLVAKPYFFRTSQHG